MSNPDDPAPDSQSPPDSAANPAPDPVASGDSLSAAAVTAAPAAVAAKLAEPSFLWLRRSDQIIVWLLAVLFLGLLGMHWMRLSRWGSAPIELSSQHPREYHYSLDINSASWVEWAQLEGIGEKLARRIVADREEKGPFRAADDVGRVRGIGPKVLERIRPFLRGGTETQSGTETDRHRS